MKAVIEVPAVGHLDPEATRRPAAHGYPVRLADGKVWFLASARPRFRPYEIPPGDSAEAIASGGDRPTIGVRAVLGYPPAAQARVDALAAAVRTGAGEVPFGLIFGAALALLLLAHDLTPADACALLTLDEAELVGLVVALDRAAGGATAEDLEAIDSAMGEAGGDD